MKIPTSDVKPSSSNILMKTFLGSLLTLGLIFMLVGIATADQYHPEPRHIAYLMGALNGALIGLSLGALLARKY